MSSLNHTSVSNYKIIFSKIPDVEFFTKSVTLPTVSVDQGTVGLPTFDMPIPGNKVIYDPITLIYNLDEDWLTWESLYNWIKGFADDNGFVPESLSEEPSSAIILGLDNHNSIVAQVDLEGVFPINVESPTLDYANPTYQDIELSATFVLQGFKFSRSKK